MLNNSVIVEGQKAATSKIIKNKIKGNNTILGPAKIGNFVNDGKTLNKNQISFMNDF
jgi:hypothetical protein